MRDFLEVDFDYLEEEEEDGELSLEGTLHDKAFKKISPQEAYTSLERLGIWVTRNFWEFERPPMEGYDFLFKMLNIIFTIFKVLNLEMLLMF
jgi:hypothetical protein